MASEGIKKIGGNRDYNVDEYVVDTVADLDKLSKMTKEGSFALVVDTADVYVLNTKHEWVLL